MSDELKPTESSAPNQLHGTGDGRLLTPPLSSIEEEREKKVEDEFPMRSQSAMNLPPVEPWPEPVDGKALLDEIRQYMRRFAVLPKWAAEILPPFVLHTYAFELRDVSTYIGLESPERRCGKSTLMILLSELVNRPEPAANISSPAFYRAIQEMQPTLLIDESDKHLKGNQQLQGILNSGYSRKLAYVLRVTNEREDSETRGHGRKKSTPHPGPLLGGGREGEPEPGRVRRGSRLARFSCWCPKVIATIGHLPETLADRCIIIRMQRKMDSEECERLKTVDATVIRRKCARFVLDHAQTIASASPQLPKGLNDRAADICEPLFVVADLAGGDWPALVRQAAVGLTSKAQEHNPIGALLLDIWLLFLIRGNRLFTHDLVAGLNSFKDRPWAEIVNGKEITDRWLAKRLHPYEIRPRTLRIGEKVAKGYVQEDFEEVYRRYVSRSDVEALRAELQVAEVGAQKAEEGGPKPEVSGQKSGDESQASEGREEKADVRAQPQETEGQKRDKTGETPGGEAAAA